MRSQGIYERSVLSHVSLVNNSLRPPESYPPNPMPSPSIRNITTFSDSDDIDDHKQTSLYRCTVSRKIWPLRMRRKKKKLATVRLGGKRQLLVRIIRRIRIRWMKMKAACTLKKLKGYYYSVLKDVIEAGGSFETFQQRLLLETSFAVPVMGLSFNTFH